MKKSDIDPAHFELVPDGEDIPDMTVAAPVKVKAPKTLTPKSGTSATSVAKKSKLDPQATLEFFRMDHTMCMIPGLIRSLKKGDRKRLKLDLTHVVGEDTYTIKAAEPLSGLDLKVFYGMAALAMKGGKVLTSSPTSDRGIRIRSNLAISGPLASAPLMVVDNSYYRLAVEIGYSDLKNANVLHENVLRWWAVGIVHTDKDHRKNTYRVIDSVSSDESTNAGNLFATLNPVATRAIIGGKAKYVRMVMREIRALQGDSAIIMHSKFCATIRPGQSHDYMIDTLIDYVWPDGNMNENTRKSRKKTMKEGLAELIALGWVCTPLKGGRKYTITRPHQTAADKAEEAEASAALDLIAGVVDA